MQHFHQWLRTGTTARTESISRKEGLKTRISMQMNQARRGNRESTDEKQRVDVRSLRI